MNSEKEKKSKQIAKPKVENIGQNPPPYSPVHATAREIPKSAEWQEGKDRNNAQTDRRTKRRSDGKKKELMITRRLVCISSSSYQHQS